MVHITEGIKSQKDVNIGGEWTKKGQGGVEEAMQGYINGQEEIRKREETKATEARKAEEAKNVENPVGADKEKIAEVGDRFVAGKIFDINAKKTAVDILTFLYGEHEEKKLVELLFEEATTLGGRADIFRRLSSGAGADFLATRDKLTGQNLTPKTQEHFESNFSLKKDEEQNSDLVKERLLYLNTLLGNVAQEGGAIGEFGAIDDVEVTDEEVDDIFGNLTGEKKD